MITVIGGVKTTVSVRMAMPERDIDKQRRQDEEALLAAGIDINKLNENIEEDSEDARFRAYYEQKMREQAEENYWDQVGLGGKDFGGYSPVSGGDDARIHVSNSSCSGNVAKYIGTRATREKGEKPTFISVVGSDALGLAARCELEQAGVDTSGMAVMEGNTPVEVEICNVIGDLEFAREDLSLMQKLTPEFIDRNEEILSRTDVIFMDGTVPVDTMNYISEKYGDRVEIYFDPGSMQGGAAFAEATLKASCVMPGRMEAEVMSGLSVIGMDQLMEAGRCFEERGIGRTIITLKGGGLYYKEGPQAGIIKPETKVNLKDTKGAGDVLSAELVYSLAEGRTFEEATGAAMRATAVYLERRGTE